MHATSVNPIDVLIRAGQLAQFLPLALPVIPGRDAVGVVDEVGPGVTDTQVGDIVFGLGGVSDTTAEFAVLAAGATVIGTGRESNQAYLESIGVLPTTYGPGLAERVAVLAPSGVDAALHAAPSDSLPDLLGIVGEPPRSSPSSTTRGLPDSASGKSTRATTQPSCDTQPRSGGTGSTRPASTTSFPWLTSSRRTSWLKAVAARSSSPSPDRYAIFIATAAACLPTPADPGHAEMTTHAGSSWPRI